MNEITIYVDEIHINDGEITVTDEKEIAKAIKSHISHLGNFEIYYKKIDKPKTFWGRFKRAFLY